MILFFVVRLVAGHIGDFLSWSAQFLAFKTSFEIALIAVAAILGFFGLAQLGHMADLGGSVGRMAVYSRELMMKMGVWRE